MAVKIKLKRLGKVREPHYRIIVADAHTKRDGRAIEELGKYSPKEEPSFIEVKSERVQYWLSVGAQPTEPVHALLRKTGDWQRFKGEELPEGLKTPQQKPDKKAIFEEAAKEAQAEEASSAASGKGKKSGQKGASSKGTDNSSQQAQEQASAGDTAGSTAESSQGED